MSWGMLRDIDLRRYCDWASIATLLSLALLVSGCSSGGGLGAPAATATDPSAPPASSSATSLKDKISNFFSGSSANSQQAVTGTQQNLDCPTIDIRQGASTLTIGSTASNDDGTSGNTNNGAMALKYQGTFVRAARECAVVGANVVMKVGVEGRIIVGPAGGPGQVDVPLRIAVVNESPTGAKPIVTKFIPIAVTVASATDNPIFTHIEEGLSFPLPSAGDLDNYVVYIGFDPLAPEAQSNQKPKAKPNPKPKAKPAATTG
jgi:hypothetical protein